MVLGKPKVNSLQQVGGTGGMSFTRKQDNGAVKSLNAKKLDIDFGGDDFFNSFQPAAPEEPAFAFGGEKKPSSKLKEVNSDSFGWGGNLGGSSDNQNAFNLGGGGSAYQNQLDEEAARAKLASMGNRKAISSEDF